MGDRLEGPTRADWVAAGLAALANGGIEAVKVERLASALGVSKGPFYWRFGNRTELLEAIVQFWKQDFTAALIEQTSHLETPRARLEALAEAASTPMAGGLDVAKTECALRAWAAQDELPRAAVREVDAARMEHVTEELERLGASTRLARQLAQAIYLALLGLFTLRQYTPELADEEPYLLAVRLALDAAERR